MRLGGFATVFLLLCFLGTPKDRGWETLVPRTWKSTPRAKPRPPVGRAALGPQPPQRPSEPSKATAPRTAATTNNATGPLAAWNGSVRLPLPAETSELAGRRVEAVYRTCVRTLEGLRTHRLRPVCDALQPEHCRPLKGGTLSWLAICRPAADRNRSAEDARGAGGTGITVLKTNSIRYGSGLNVLEFRTLCQAPPPQPSAHPSPHPCPSPSLHSRPYLEALQTWADRFDDHSGRGCPHGSQVGG